MLDRFPRLRIVPGHMGEALPFWSWRLDDMASPGSRANLRKQLSAIEHCGRDCAITTSGIEDPLVCGCRIDEIGIDNERWAMDHM